MDNSRGRPPSLSNRSSQDSRRAVNRAANTSRPAAATIPSTSTTMSSVDPIADLTKRLENLSLRGNPSAVRCIRQIQQSFVPCPMNKGFDFSYPFEKHSPDIKSLRFHSTVVAHLRQMPLVSPKVPAKRPIHSHIAICLGLRDEGHDIRTNWRKKRKGNSFSPPLWLSETHSLPTFRFLNLPAELRIQVYDFFREVPLDQPRSKPSRTEEDDQESVEKYVRRHKILQGRASLRRLCRKVSQEWDPIFFRTTTIMIMPLDPIWGPVALKCQPRCVELLSFLKETSFGEKLRGVRRLVYREERSRGGESICPAPSLDPKNLHQLPSILKDPAEYFVGLREVVISQNATGIFPESESWETIWDKFEGPGKRWEGYEKRFRLDMGLEVMKHWGTTRRLELGELDHKRSVNSVQLIFCKGITTPAPGYDAIDLPGKFI